MRFIIIFVFLSLLFSCTNNRSVYWCGDHACINNKERKSYFKKTMIVEKRKLTKDNKLNKSEFEKIKKRAKLDQKREIKEEKETAKQAKLDRKRKIKEQKEAAKQAKLDEKKRIKEEKEAAKKAKLDEKRRIKEEKELKKKIIKEEKLLNKKSKKNKNLSTYKKADIIISNNEFSDLKDNVIKKNMLRPYPDINDIPN